MNTKIICACHNGISESFDPIIMKYKDIFVPILGGADYAQIEKDSFLSVMQKDNEGENISWANPLCSEATQLYWAYKHFKRLGNPDMIGLCHYRRVFDLDYNNLDPDTVYLKECHYPIPGHPDFLGNYWSDSDISVLVKDEFIYHFPQFKEIVDLVREDFTFYDKEMFVMNRLQFLNYMDYVVACLRILLDIVRPQALKWYTELPSPRIAKFCYTRGCSYFLEYFALLYFTRLKVQGYKIQVTPLTKDSYNGN